MAFTSSSGSVDFGKYIADQLVARSELMMKLLNYCEEVKLPQGMGKTANFTKIGRTDVPVDKLTDGVTPSETAFSMTQHSVVVDQWGMFLTATDQAKWTVKHPIFEEMLALVADALQRTREYNCAEVLNDGTNVQYYDGTRATRSAILSTDRLDASVIEKCVVQMGNDGAPRREGGLYVAVCSVNVLADLRMDPSAIGGWQAAKTAVDSKKLETGVVGEWRGVKWIQSNFLPVFQLLSAAGTVTATTGGAIANGTYYYKVTRKSLQRGFEEDIGAEGSIVLSGSNDGITLTAPSDAGYVYNFYIGASTGDANLFLVKENLAASGVYEATAIPTSGTNPPATPASGVAVHPVYVFAARAVDSVELSGSSVRGIVTDIDTPAKSDPLHQRRHVGGKYMAKEGIRDITRIRRIEVASAF